MDNAAPHIILSDQTTLVQFQTKTKQKKKKKKGKIIATEVV